MEKEPWFTWREGEEKPERLKKNQERKVLEARERDSRQPWRSSMLSDSERSSWMRNEKRLLDGSKMACG